jgi:hypothetical protein
MESACSRQSLNSGHPRREDMKDILNAKSNDANHSAPLLHPSSKKLSQSGSKTNASVPFMMQVLKFGKKGDS